MTIEHFKEMKYFKDNISVSYVHVKQVKSCKVMSEALFPVTLQASGRVQYADS